MDVSNIEIINNSVSMESNVNNEHDTDESGSNINDSKTQEITEFDENQTKEYYFHLYMQAKEKNEKKEKEKIE